jgi:hypothetical protein
VRAANFKKFFFFFGMEHVADCMAYDDLGVRGELAKRTVAFALTLLHQIVKYRYRHVLGMDVLFERRYSHIQCR